MTRQSLLEMPTSRVLQFFEALTAGATHRSEHQHWNVTGRPVVLVTNLLAMASTNRHYELPACDVSVNMADIRAAQRGDSEAYRSIVEQSQNTIAVQMRRFSRDPQVCEDLTHDVFVEAFFSLHSFRGNAPWIHWLRRVAVRVGYRYWKEKKHNGTIQRLTDEQWQTLRGAGPDLQVASEAADLVSVLLEQLSPDDRLVLTMTCLDGCSMTETASRCGWTVAGTKLRAFRARKKLVELIERGLS